MSEQKIEVPPIDPDELNLIISDHINWLVGHQGKRADLSFRCLRKSDMHGAVLCNAILNCADLCKADLSGANLERAFLRDAYLYEADLSEACLKETDFRRSNLSKADLSYTDLRWANFEHANLSGSDFTGANIHGVNFTGATGFDSMILPAGFTGRTYKSKVVPALLAAGGRDPREVAEKSWNCHTWENCPMAEAFGVKSLEEIPPLYQEQAQLFVRLFDCGLIPRPFSDENAG